MDELNLNNKNEFNIVVLGAAGTGKTCFLYSLIKHLENSHMFSNLQYSSDALSDIRTSRIPQATNSQDVPPPISFELANDKVFISKIKINIHEIPGECCFHLDTLTPDFKSVLKKADGIIYVVDPLIFIERDKMDMCMYPLDAISRFFMSQNTYGVDIPIAVCISKIDSPIFQNMDVRLGTSLKNLLNSISDDFVSTNELWMETIASMSNILYEFIHQRAQHLDLQMKYAFDKYNYFAFSSLGFRDKSPNIGFQHMIPIGVENPFWWIMHQMNLCTNPIRQELNIPIRVCCPVCNYPLVKRLEGKSQYIYSSKKSLFSTGYQAIESHTCPKYDSYWNEKKRVKSPCYRDIYIPDIANVEEKEYAGHVDNVPKAYKGNDKYAFISYSHEDMVQVFSVLGKLSENEYRFWFDEAIEVGNHWDEEIAKYIENCECFIVMLSRNYLGSDNCGDELHFAREIKKKILIVYIEDFEPDNAFKFRYGRIQSVPYKADVNMILSKLTRIEELIRCKG